MDSPGRCARILGDKTLRAIARALVKTVRNNVTIDWTMRETVRAQLRVLVKRTLRKYGYPPDREERATRTVLKQAELFGDQWVGRQVATELVVSPVLYRIPRQASTEAALYDDLTASTY